MELLKKKKGKEKEHHVYFYSSPPNSLFPPNAHPLCFPGSADPWPDHQGRRAPSVDHSAEAPLRGLPLTFFEGL